MHPAFFAQWKAARDRCECGPHAGRGPGGGHGWFAGPGPFGHGPPGHAPFGTRRPLRYLTHKLDLDDDQATAVAAILDDLKTEHAQAAVDDRRALKALAETMGAAAFDASAAQAATKQRLESLERLQASVVEALERLHALLEPDQRGRLEHLMRTGAIVL